MSSPNPPAAKPEKMPPPRPPKKQHLSAPTASTQLESSSIHAGDGIAKVPSNCQERNSTESIAAMEDTTEPSSETHDSGVVGDKEQSTGDVDPEASESSQGTTMPKANSEAGSSDTSVHDVVRIHQGDADDETPTSTGIGREAWDEKGKRVFIDEAEWSIRPPLGSSTFPINISWSSGKEKLTITGPLLLKAFDIILKNRRDPYITKSDDSISFDFPYVPLYFHYHEVIKSAKRELDSSSRSFDNKEAAALQLWYERWVLPAHTKIQETIKTGWITYEDIWALFRPGDIVFSLDKFKQPRLYFIAATALRNNSGLADLPPIPFFSSFQKRRFALELGFINWDSSIQMFKREKRTESIAAFSGSRRVTDLEFYPLQFYKDGNRQAIDELLADLQQRGHQWKTLVSEAPTCMHHNGPATEFRTPQSGAVFQTERKENRNV